MFMIPLMHSQVQAQEESTAAVMTMADPSGESSRDSEPSPAGLFQDYLATLTPPTAAEYARVLEKYKEKNPGAPAILIEIGTQTLYLIRDGVTEARYTISSSSYGIGSQEGSNRTPLGLHYICRMIGKGARLGTIFAARANTGKVAKIYTEAVDVKDDLVLTRIIRLRGLEKGLNSGKGVDSYGRFIYIHGTPEEGLIGKPASHGCIRMKNSEVIDLFDRVGEGVAVLILP